MYGKILMLLILEDDDEDIEKTIEKIEIDSNKIENVNSLVTNQWILLFISISMCQEPLGNR